MKIFEDILYGLIEQNQSIIIFINSSHRLRTTNSLET